MNKFQWKFQATLFRFILKMIPTCFLQEELSNRVGVTSQWIPLGKSVAERVSGPCVLTINRD